MPYVSQVTHPDTLKQRALVGFGKHANVSAGCAAAGIGRTTWYDWIAQDPLFARLVQEYDEAVSDRLDVVAQERAGDTEKGSDTLLIFLLKGRRRGKYGDREVLTIVHPDVQMRIQATAQLIASRDGWPSSKELLEALDEVWK